MNSRLSDGPRARLGFFPTPIVRLKRLEKELGEPGTVPRILMKRDDQTGLGLGGNKTRKLEYLLGEALARNADCVITAGAAQSNHCRQTAAGAAACGLGCLLVLGGSEPEIPNGNLLLDSIFGAEIHWSGEHRKGEDIPRIEGELRAAGLNPYVVPYGGSSPTGALGFAAAMEELRDQLSETGDTVDRIVFASSSGGTHAGMLVGRDITGLEMEITGIRIDREDTGGRRMEESILDLAEQTAALLDHGYSPAPGDPVLVNDYLGGGYGVVGELEREAVSLLGSSEGILVDPVYTGRALGGMLDMIRRGGIRADETVLFWHTGGTPSLFADPAAILPESSESPGN